MSNTNKKMLISAIIAIVCIAIFINIGVKSTSSDLPSDKNVERYLTSEYRSTKFENVTYLQTIHTDSHVIGGPINCDGATLCVLPEKEIPAYDSIYYSAYAPKEDMQVYIQYVTNHKSYSDTFGLFTGWEKDSVKIIDQAKNTFSNQITDTSYSFLGKENKELHKLLNTLDDTEISISDIFHSSILWLMLDLDLTLDDLETTYYDKVVELEQLVDANSKTRYSSISIVLKTKDNATVTLSSVGIFLQHPSGMLQNFGNYNR